MQLTLRKRTSERKISEIDVPYYYKIDIKGSNVYGCVTQQFHYIVRIFVSNGGLRCEVERLSLEDNNVCLEYSENRGELFFVSDKQEFYEAMLKVASVSKDIAVDIVGSSVETGG